MYRNFSGYLYRGTWPISNYLAIAHHIIFFMIDQTLYSAVSFMFVIMLPLFWFFIFFVIVLGNVSYNLLSIIHSNNSYHELAISISVGLLLLIVDHYGSSLVWLLSLFSKDPGSDISMLLNVLSCCSTCFPVEGISYILALCMFWLVDVSLYLLLSFHFSYCRWQWIYMRDWTICAKFVLIISCLFVYYYI